MANTARFAFASGIPGSEPKYFMARSLVLERRMTGLEIVSGIQGFWFMNGL
jgi:hypothetical protein